MDITLYEFPVSHYAEKVRWALDYKMVSYRTEKLIPGLHFPVTLALAGVTTVPILTVNGQARAESTDILLWLDKLLPHPALFPTVGTDRARVLELIHWSDHEIGLNVRRLVYATIREDNHFFAKLLTTGLEGWQKSLVEFSAPLLTRAIAVRYNADDDRKVAESREKTENALDILAEKLGNRPFLVGPQLTAADITAASLLYPLVLPKEHPYNLPRDLPVALTQFKASYANHPAIQWAEAIYRQYRHRKMYS